MISLDQLANPQFADLVPYEPGKPIEDVARELGLEPEQIIKLASNENPLGPSPMALEAAQRELARAHIYPDGGGYRLRVALAQHYGLERENIVLGCGCNEIIQLLFDVFTRPGVNNVVVSRHAFSVYKIIAQQQGVRCLETPDRRYAHDLEAMLAAITPETRLVFVASPNNPTGTRVANAELDRFIQRLPDHVVLALDEAYYEFLSDPPQSLRYVREGRKVALLRTFSKAQGLAGLRIGYALATAKLADLLQRARQPFNTSSVAQAAAFAGLQDADHVRKTVETVNAGRTRMETAFGQMGLEYVRSSANFVLVKVGEGQKIFEQLLRRGIIVRPMASWGLPEFIRVSVGTPEQVERFLKELALVAQRAGGV